MTGSGRNHTNGTPSEPVDRRNEHRDYASTSFQTPSPVLQAVSR